MIRDVRLSHIVTIFSLILILLVGQTGGTGYVWCFGIDGHTVLEPVHDSCCGEQKSQLDMLSSEVSVDHCDSCLDLLLSSCYASQRLRDDLLSFESVVVVSPVTKLFLRVAALALQPQSIVAEVIPRIRDQILHHRTIVLLN